ncbi:MAG: 50S ribosomal protein L24 [bacterium]
MNIRRNDIVVATRGREKGKQGKVLQVIVEKRRVLVEGLNLMTKHLRKSQDNPKGGITKKEASIALANLMLYCQQCKKAVRVKRVAEGDKRVRKCKKCGQSFDA